MKKKLLGLLCACCLLAGCQEAVPQPAQTVPSTTVPAPTEAPMTLMDPALAAGETGNLLYIPNESMERMACPELRLFDGSLLAYEQTMTGQLNLKRISLADGSLLAEASCAMTPAVRIQVGEDRLILCDSGSGQVVILDGTLQPLRTYTVPQEGESWFLDREMKTLYAFFSEKGLLARDLESGSSRWILENAAQLLVYDVENDCVRFSYTDRADQRTYNRCLELSTGTLQSLTTDSSAGIHASGQWLLRQNNLGEYLLLNGENTGCFTWPEGTAQLLRGDGLLTTDADHRELYLYDLDGTFRSRCVLPRIDYASVGLELVWSDDWQGYFFRDTYDNIAHLMFWDPTAAQEGADLAILPPDVTFGGEPVLPQELYDRAQAISRRFGVEIRIGEQCALTYSHYESTMLTDPVVVQTALDTLERALGVYPDGFFDQLLFGTASRIRIELTAKLQTKVGVDSHPDTANGFAQDAYDHHLLVLKGDSLEDSTVFHELSHIIDKRLAWDAQFRPGALFSEEAWLALQPEGFRFAESYTDFPEELKAFEYSDYFARSYSMTFPTEDRATTMALVMTHGDSLRSDSGLMQKMRFYAACIRDCFNTEGWPEVAPWEVGFQD